MITKLAKAKDNWFFKILSAAVAVSFISLFGVTGYITTASQNQTVVQVGKRKIMQSEFSYRLQKELNALKNLSGDDYEISDEIRTLVSENVLQQLIDENVLDQAMLKYNIHFPKAFVQRIIFTQPEFLNPANGQFHPEIFKRYLSNIGMSEDEYVAFVQRTMARKMMITDLLVPFNVPQALSNAVAKMDNQRKSFKYTIVSPQDMKVERKISDEEIQQYFADFSENFEIPETRDAKVLFVSNDYIINKYAADEQSIRDYFEQHQKELDQPEKREVLQTVFMNKDAAEKAYAALQNDADFEAVAKEYNAENAEQPTLGIVAEDELAEDLAPAFNMKAGETKLLQVADTWQIIKVKEVIAAKEAVFDEVKAEIANELANENMYDALRTAKAEIDDAINGGKTLEEVAEMFQTNVFDVKNIQEETLVQGVPANAQDLASSLDFNDLVFSYGLDEITSAEEFDSGVAVIQITNIVDAHLPEIDDVRDKIISLWTIQEKDALAKETADNILADIEDGSELAVAAKARDLEAFRSAPISRNETFAQLSKLEVAELFTVENGAVKMFEHSGNNYVIATPFETVNYDDALTEEKLNDIKQRVSASLLQDMTQSALDNFAKDFKIKVDYKRAGFAE